MTIVLFVIAVVLAVAGIASLLQGDIIWGLVLLVVAAAIGPGGWSVFGRRG
jgi:hypothetical protein